MEVDDPNDPNSAEQILQARLSRAPYGEDTDSDHLSQQSRTAAAVVTHDLSQFNNDGLDGGAEISNEEKDLLSIKVKDPRLANIGLGTPVSQPSMQHQAGVHQVRNKFSFGKASITTERESCAPMPYGPGSARMSRLELAPPTPINPTKIM